MAPDANEWPLLPLHDVATLQRGIDLPVQDRIDGDVPVLGSNGVVGHHNTAPFDGPGVVTGRSGSIGLVFYSPGPYWPLNTTLYVKDFHGNDPEFVARMLQHLRLERFVAATGVPSLNRNFVHPLLVRVPPIPEQRRIADILDAVDAAVLKTEDMIAKLNQVRQGLLHDLLTRGVDDNGELRDPKRHPEKFKESPLGLLPAAWEVTPIGAAGELRLGKQKSPDAPRGDRTRRYLRVVNIFDDRLDLRDINEMTFSPSEFERYRLAVGDILLTEGDLASAHNVGRSAVFRGEIENCCYQNSLLRFRLSDRQVPDFFHFAFCQLRKLGVFAAATMSTTVFHLSAGRLIPIPIMRPPTAEQIEIANRLNALDRRVDAELASVAKLAALKAGLTEDLLTGRVRVEKVLELATA